MNEEPTKNLPGRNSFEERVFARFDAVDARLEKLESRSYDTKPIWERALKAIMETSLELGEVKKKLGVIETKVDVIETKVDVIETKVDVIDNRVGVLETEVAGIRTDYGGIRNEFEDLKQELVRQLTRRLDLVLRTLVDQRDELRAAEDRITQLESKLA